MHSRARNDRISQPRTRVQSPKTFLDQLPIQIASIFDQAQNSIASHQKNLVSLYKLYIEASRIRIGLPEKDGGMDSGFDSDEEDQDQDKPRCLRGSHEFERIIYVMTLRLLNSKKGSAGDRAVKFFAEFVNYLHEKAAAQEPHSEEEEEEEEDPENEDKDELDLDQEDFDMDSGCGTSARSRSVKPKLSASDTAVKFTEDLVKNLLANGFAARDKQVRYRSVELSARIALRLGQINSSLYYTLRANLLDRILDKDWTIRHQAGIALCMFYRVDDLEELEEMSLASLCDVLLDALAYDPKEQIRLSILQNLAVNDDTIAGILDRTKDSNVDVRKEAYVLLGKNVTVGLDNEDENDEVYDDEDDEEKVNGEMGRAHPRNLTIFQRDSIIKNGLGDRESNVRESAVRLLTIWIGAVAIGPQAALLHLDGNGTANDIPTAQGKQKQKVTLLEDVNLVQLLRLFNLRATNEELSGAIIHIFEAHPQLTNALSDSFAASNWSSFTPEMVFLMRVYVEYCVKIKSDARLEEMLPVTTALAFHLHERFKVLVEAIQETHEEYDDGDDVARATRQDDIDDKEFVAIEMVKIAIHGDFGDEIGRRKMQQLVCLMLTDDDLPEGLIAPCIWLLQKILGTSDRDLIRIVSIDVLQTLRLRFQDEITVDAALLRRFDSIDVSPRAGPSRERGNGSHEFIKDSERTRERRDWLDMRCLCICELLLELVKNLSDNPFIKKFVQSCAQRDTNDHIKEKAFRCYALLSLVSLCSVGDALNFFIERMKPGCFPEELWLVAMQAIFDILLWYGQKIMVKECRLRNEKALTSRFVNVLKNYQLSEDMRALLCAGLVKLMYDDVLVNEEITNLLVENYFSPEYTQNLSLKQCLSYFFPLYCRQFPINQERISVTFMPVFIKICSSGKTEGLDLDERILFLERFGDILLTWTHPEYLLKKEKGKEKLPLEDNCIQLHIAFEIVMELLNKESKLLKEHKKILCKLLTRIYLPENVDDADVRHLEMLMSLIPTFRPLPNAPSKNALKHFYNVYIKKYQRKLEAFSEDNFRSLEDRIDDTLFLDDIMNSADKDDTDEVKAPGGRKRKLSSTVENTTGIPSGRKFTKRARRSISRDDEDEPEQQGGEHSKVSQTQHQRQTMSASAPAQPTSQPHASPVPKRPALSQQPIDISDSDSD